MRLYECSDIVTRLKGIFSEIKDVYSNTPLCFDTVRMWKMKFESGQQLEHAP